MDRRIEVCTDGACEQLVNAAGSVLDQCEALVHATPALAYAAESRSMRGGTIGKHLRHTLDHYIAALAVIGESDGLINYDQRRRNTPIESDKSAALAGIRDLRSRLAAAGSEGLSRPVRVRVMIDAEGGEVDLASTLGRELAFATHHAIHHQAMMRAMACEFGIDLEESFGKAPSTINAEQARR